MSWQACACSGDTTCALLQPHQVLVSHEDATTHCIKHLDLIRVSLKLQQSAIFVLECVIDRRQAFDPGSAKVYLCSGRIQLHSWVLDVCSQEEDTIVTLEKAPLAPLVSIWLSFKTKFPLVATFDSSSVRLESKYSSVDLMFGSALNKTNLEEVVRRQLCASGTILAAEVGQLVPVTLFGETYVFKVDNVKYKAASEEQIRVVVSGWSNCTNLQGPADLTEQLTMLSIKEKVDTDAALSYVNKLETRLWHTGFVGYSSFVQDVLLCIVLMLKHGQKGHVNDMKIDHVGSQGVLLSGVNGVGKSLALIALHGELDRKKIRTWCVDGMSLLMGAANSAFSSAFEYLVYNLEQHFPGLDFSGDRATVSSTCPGVVLIDDLDVLFQSVDEQVTGSLKSQLSQVGFALLRLMDECSLSNRHLVFVGVTTSAELKIPASAKRIGRFEKVFDLVVPTQSSRREIIRRNLVGLPIHPQDICATDESDFHLASRLALLTGGFVAKDLVRICRNAVAQAYADLSNDGVSLKPSISWSYLLQAQQKFADFISWKFHPTAAMSRLGISNASGILLSGPSGCGKTLLVKTMAAQAQVNFVSVKSSELLSKYLGDSENAVRQLFARARAAAPCLLFFDEFDSIAYKRSFGKGDDGSSGGGVYARVLSTILNEMDGVGSHRVATPPVSLNKNAFNLNANGEGILVVAASNRKDSLDAALVRPGRIDKSLELSYPSRQDIQEIFALYTSKMPLAADVDLQALTARPRGCRMLTGADIAAICKEAAFRALREDVEAKLIHLCHFNAAWDQRAEISPTLTTHLKPK
ncbi:cell division cycle protein 48 [Plasmopara halstedii]|uniref:Cell division cycle protein 48 n=1 Tax=Plasmopara halstedii TaxID=4781 RepID=A0A0P1A4N0_PLAHL|nr:cell division cycle protein 48 [Plasmopara halstedii]CEG35440.1 cell division cycle protein 48 [Plasmopara halstedii]|eukprot:XP_024571809.1 cell division cycle protein 48 [Plasmopara halstedii]